MKRLKMFFKKHLKKCLVLLSVFVISFSCFVISASAESIAFKTPYAKPTVTENSGYIEIYLKDSNGKLACAFTWFFTVIGTDDSFYLSEPFVKISVPSANRVDAEVIHTSFDDAVVPLTFSYGYCSSYDSGCAVYYKSTLQDSLSVNCWFPTNYSVALIRCYGICVPNESYNSYFNGYANGSVVYGEDVIINDKIDILINHLTDYQTEIQQSIQQGNQQIINNANQNVDKILNSGEYTLDMGDSTIRLESIEKSIFESINLKQVGSSIFDSVTWWADLSPAIMSAGIILDELLNFGGIQYTWFMTVVRFSLAIGVFALFLAIVPNIAKSSSSSSSNKGTRKGTRKGASNNSKGASNNSKGGKK